MGQYRGAYRSIAAVLVDGPDFQALSPDAKLVFLVVKVALGPAGIDVVPSAIAATAERTGLTPVRVQAAFAELADAAWLYVVGNVVWVIRGLEFEPHLNLNDHKHIGNVRRHVEGLPRTPLVAAFIARYEEWFEDAEALLSDYPTPYDHQSARAIEGPSKGHRRAIEGPSKGLPRAIEAQRQRQNLRQRQKQNITSAFEGPSEDQFDLAWRAYPRRPNNSRAKALRAWTARLKAGVSPETLLAGVRAYAAYCERERIDPQFVKMAATFFGPDEHWLADYGPAPSATVKTYDANGEMTPEVLRALGRSAA